MAKNKILSKIGKFIKGLVEETEEQENEIETNVYIHAAVECLNTALNYLQIHPEEKKSDDYVFYRFIFQAGYFIIEFCEDSQSTFRITFPNIANCPIEEINMVRTTCNRLNINNIQINAYYTEGDENDIVVNLTCDLPRITDVRDMVHALLTAFQDCFSAQKGFGMLYDDIKKNSISSRISDLEYTQFTNRRIKNIVAEAEIYKGLDNDAFDPDATVSDVEMYALSTWLKTYNLLPPTFHKWVKMECEGDDGYHFTTQDSDTIHNYCIVEPIVHKIGEKDDPQAKIGLIKLTYTRTLGENKEVDNHPHLMLIALEHVMSENNITYIRINAMSPERRAVNDRNFNATKQDELLTARTMMIAVDYKDGKSKGTEFSYMWKDAIDKKREGKTDEWTVEQKFIYDITSPNTAYDLYWGYKFFVQKRYYEASLHFHRAWSRMNKRYSLLEQWEIEKYNEVSFMLGESYLKMDLYPQAFFHFDGLAKEGNVEFTAELIKTLMAANDYRAYDLTNQTRISLRMFLDNAQKEETEVDESLYHFYDFVERCHVVLSIDYHYLDAAENDCKNMIQENRNLDFAHKGLERIQNMRNSGIESIKRPEAPNNP